jgi:hypothetical protein
MVPLIVVPLMLLASCGGRTGSGAVRIEGPSFEPRRVAIRTLEPGPTPTPTPKPTPTPVPTPSPTPIPPPGAATLTSHAGTQKGDVSSFCWSSQVGSASKCYPHDQPSQPRALAVRSGEKAILRIDAKIPPDDESVRPFQGSRSGYPAQQIEPALETELTVDLPEGEWSMDLCAAWHGRGQPICWLFKLAVSKS